MYASFDVEWLTRAAICRVVSHSAGSLLSTAFSRADAGAIRITVTSRLTLQLPLAAIRPFLWCGKWNRASDIDGSRLLPSSQHKCRHPRLVWQRPAWPLADIRETTAKVRFR